MAIGHYLVDCEGGSDISPDEGQWAHEGEHDHLSAEELRRLQNVPPSEVVVLLLGHAQGHP